jgi:NAD(P)-dependent dehydrogenase (short-subunit alcohol dehydrogenase family)
MNPTGRLYGKAAIITGGEGSIGLATARAFAAEGARVCLVGLGEDELRAGACELGDAAIWTLADVTSSVQVTSAVARAAETFGRLDVVVSNAGISGVIAPVADYPEDVFDQVLAVHVRGSFLVCKHSLPYLEAGASVIITSSVVGLTSAAGICAYATAKTRAGRADAHAGQGDGAARHPGQHHPPGPGGQRVPAPHRDRGHGADRDQAASIFEQLIPLARHAAPDEVARTMLFLASDESSFITGTTLTVDGGMSI